MSIENLKKRARNLQRAAQAMFGQPVKLGQAYELIAQEEGYANWDIASSALQARPNPDAIIVSSPSVRLAEYLVIKKRELIDGMVCLTHLAQDQPGVIPILNHLVTSTPKLILISGKTGVGKSSLATALMIHGHQSTRPIAIKSEDDSPSKSKEIVDFPYGRHAKDAFRQAVMSALRARPDRIYVGELRNPEAFELALEMVLTGTTVIAEVCGDRGQSMTRLLIERGLASGGENRRLEDMDQIDKIHLHLHSTDDPD